MMAGWMNFRMYAEKAQWVSAWLNAGILVVVVAVIADNMRVWIGLLRRTEPDGLNIVPETNEPKLEVPD